MCPPPPPPKLDERGLPPPRVTFDMRGELPFWIFLAVSAVVFATGVFLGTYYRPAPQILRTDLDYLEGVENEPPPLGDPNAGAPAPEKPPEPEPPPEPPPPVPEPPPVPVPDFAKPEEKPPATPAPERPKPPKPAPGTPRPVIPNHVPAGTGAGESNDPNAKPGTKGVPNGVPGGRGGQQGGFIARPDMPLDNMIVTRKYYGRGTAQVVCAGGRIVSVSMSASIGFTHCDEKAVKWIRDHWTPAPGTNGAFTFPVIVKP